MTIIGLVILIVVCGVILWAVNAYVPMEPRLKNLLNVVVIVFVAIVAVIFLLQLLGVNTSQQFRLTN